jgi:hypothetical protein
VTSKKSCIFFLNVFWLKPRLAAAIIPQEDQVMSTSRRSFIKSGSMVALAASIPGGLSKAIQVTAREVSAKSSFALTKAAFEANLKSVFLVRASDSDLVSLKLTKVEDLRRHRKGKVAAANKEGFSLLFEGPRGLTQSNYRFEHEKMGKFDLLMVPVESRKKRGHSYEVIINRLFV